MVTDRGLADDRVCLWPKSSSVVFSSGASLELPVGVDLASGNSRIRIRMSGSISFNQDSVFAISRHDTAEIRKHTIINQANMSSQSATVGYCYYTFSVVFSLDGYQTNVSFSTYMCL